MPSGRTHTTINIGCLALASSLALTQRWPLEPVTVIAGVASFLIGTLLLSPDLDLSNSVRTESQRHWGRLGWIWIPYGMIFKHRGLSHSWIVGPASRIGYLALLTHACGYLWSITAGSSQTLRTLEFKLPELLTATLYPSSQTQLAILGGYLISQWLHLLADGITPDGKKAH